MSKSTFWSDNEAPGGSEPVGPSVIEVAAEPAQLGAQRAVELFGTVHRRFAARVGFSNERFVVAIDREQPPCLVGFPLNVALGEQLRIPNDPPGTDWRGTIMAASSPSRVRIAPVLELHAAVGGLPECRRLP